MTPIAKSNPQTAGTPEAETEAIGDATSPTLLNRVRDWTDNPAWIAFLERYDPLLRVWCRRFGLDADASDELCQRIWVELMGRMRTFRYDPSRGFRGWLRRLFDCRAIDLLRHRRSNSLPLLDEDALEVDPRGGRDDMRIGEDSVEEEAGSVPSVLLREGEAAQEAVRSRVDPETWRAFWMIAIEDQPVRVAAESLGKRYAAVYNGYKRVDQMLRREGRRRLPGLMIEAPASCRTD